MKGIALNPMESVINNNAVLRGLNRAIIVHQPTDDCSDLIIIDMNEIAESIEKVNRKDVIGRKITEVFPGIAEAGLLDTFMKVWRTGVPEHIDKKEYKHGWRENDILKLDSGEVVAIYDDTTIQKQAEISLLEYEKRYHAIISASFDGFIILDKIKYILDANESFLKRTGYKMEELLNRSIYSISPQKYHTLFPNVAETVRTVGHIIFESQIVCSNGDHIDVEVSANNVGEGKWTFCFFKDITERKQREAELLYIGYHDKLTGLYNRAFFEIEIKRLDVPRQYPISFIMADINGLKFANDAFGHEHGDELLKEFAGVLKSCLRKDDIIARWGGDEFVVLLPKTTYETSIKICERIKNMAERIKIGPLSLSVALGLTAKDAAERDFSSIIKDTENLMYQNKLLDKKSGRSEIVTSLTKAMREMNYETEEHEQRMLEKVNQLGSKLELMPREIEELRLLAILHDIGKLGVSKDILMKPGSLTPKEWDEIKKHSEIGCRIAESTPGLAHISKYILSVHERWDGKGYPQGLKGTAIPKLSRIITIVDAFDAMVSGRPYKNPVTRDEAVKEINMCSGTQFDPFLVGLFNETYYSN